MGCYANGCENPLYSSGLCSTHYNRLRTRGTVEDGPRSRCSFSQRLWRQIDRREVGECWPWTSKSKIAGYGVIGRGGRGQPKVLAHRAVWEVTNGPIPDGPGHHGMVVMHTCDNRLCCNPAHLVLGTQSDNVRDMDAKGRRKTVAISGEKHHKARLTTAQIDYIRTCQKTNLELMRELGSNSSTISAIRRGLSRKLG